MNQDKYKQLLKVSDPDEVNRRSFKYYKKPVYLSTRKNKKYMIEDNEGKWRHFGDIFYSDFTKHKDYERRNNFKNRNWKWENAPKYSSARLSWILLWT